MNGRNQKTTANCRLGRKKMNSCSRICNVGTSCQILFSFSQRKYLYPHFHINYARWFPMSIHHFLIQSSIVTKRNDIFLNYLLTDFMRVTIFFRAYRAFKFHFPCMVSEMHPTFNQGRIQTGVVIGYNDVNFYFTYKYPIIFCLPYNHACLYPPLHSMCLPRSSRATLSSSAVPRPGCF